MVKRLNTDCVRDFSGALKKAFTAAEERPSTVTVGFEWEIPYIQNARNESPFITPGTNNPLNHENLRRLGFNGHHDSGGWEVGSPVFDNISTTRRFARWLQEAAEEDYRLRPDSPQLGNCGIHVHVSDKGTVPCHGTPELEELYRQFRGGGVHPLRHLFENNENYRHYLVRHSVIDLVLNRAENQDWLWRFSRRMDGSMGYRDNAMATCWDTGRSGFLNRSMFRSNLNPGASGVNPTHELRIWKGVTDRLIPAIEFTHSYYRFIRKWCKAQGYEELVSLFFDLTGSSDYPVDYRTDNASELNAVLPRMTDYFEYLYSRKGYRNLKDDERFQPDLVAA